MFSGIVEEIGIVIGADHQDDKSILTIQVKKCLDDVVIGDSVAVNGACLTVVKYEDASFCSIVGFHEETRGHWAGIMRLPGFRRYLPAPTWSRRAALHLRCHAERRNRRNRRRNHGDFALRQRRAHGILAGPGVALERQGHDCFGSDFRGRARAFHPPGRSLRDTVVSHAPEGRGIAPVYCDISRYRGRRARKRCRTSSVSGVSSASTGPIWHTSGCPLSTTPPTSDQRVPGHRAIEISGGGRRIAPGDHRSGRRPAAHALEGVDANCHVAE